VHELVRNNRVDGALEAVGDEGRGYLHDYAKQAVVAHHRYRPCKQYSHLGKLDCRRGNYEARFDVMVGILQPGRLLDSPDALCYKREPFDHKVVDFLRNLASFVGIMDLVERIKAAHLLLLSDCPGETKTLLKFDTQYVKCDAFALGTKNF
jgi:hypothetical protein